MSALICLGLAVRDFVFRLPALPEGAGKYTASALAAGGGGIAATAAVAAARLGGRVEYWGRLGDDAPGRELRSELAACGVDVHATSPKDSQTPTAAVLVADNGERLLAVYPGRLDNAVDWLPLERVAEANAVLADFRWPDGARALFMAAASHGLPRVLDGDVGDVAAVRGLLPHCDHAVFSQAGLIKMTGTDDVQAALTQAAQLSPGVVAVTLGEVGSVFRIDGRFHRVSACAVQARDTTGAGDVFHGAYALALARGEAVLEAARFASAAAAIKCSNGSGWGAMPTSSEVNTLLKVGVA